MKQERKRQPPRIWFLRLTQWSKQSHLTLSALFFGLILALFWLLDLFAQKPQSDEFLYLRAIGNSLFVGGWIPIVFSFVVYVLGKSEHFIDALKPALSCSDDEFNQLKSTIGQTNGPTVWIAGCVGFAIGLLLQFNHIEGIIKASDQLPKFYILLIILSLMLWSLMFQVFSTLVTNARFFGTVIHQHLTVNLLDLKSVSACSSIAILPVMLAIGLYVVYPLSWIGGEVDFTSLLIPLTFTIPSLILMFLYPLLPLRRKIQRQKAQELELIRQAVNGNKSAMKNSCLGDESDNMRLFELIGYRQYINSLNDWGIDAPTLKQISLYVLLPPSTWVAAALVEQLVT